MNEVFTARQAAMRLGIPYARLLYALMRYDAKRYERYAVRLVTLSQCQEALSQVKSSARRVSA